MSHSTSTTCAIHWVLVILLNGKPMAPRHKQMPIHKCIVLERIKLILSIRILSGKRGPEANNNNCELTGYFDRVSRYTEWEILKMVVR